MRTLIQLESHFTKLKKKCDMCKTNDKFIAAQGNQFIYGIFGDYNYTADIAADRFTTVFPFNEFIDIFYFIIMVNSDQLIFNFRL